MVRPSVLYALVVWAHDLHCKCLDGLDRLTLKSITHSARLCPTRGLAVLLGQLPIPLHLQRTALCSALRHPDLVDLTWLGHSSTKRHNTSHRAYWSDLLRHLDVSSPTDYLRTVNPPANFRVVRASFSGCTKFHRPSQITIYTDGSKMNDRVGTGYVIYKGTTEYLSLIHI